MTTELFIHKMTEHMDRARILKWLVHEGEAVTAGQVVMEVETEKAVVELEAPASGIIKGIRAGAEDGAEVAVGETLAYIVEEGEQIPTLPPLGEAASEPSSAANGQGSMDTAPARLEGEVSTGAAESGTSVVKATPVARRVAKDLGVDLRQVTGSGPNGVIRHTDVRAFAASLAPASVPTPGGSEELRTPTPEPQPALDPQPSMVALTPFQRITGQRMLESVQTAPQFTVEVRVDMSGMLALRQSHSQDGGKAPSITACLVRAAAAALKRHPRLNSYYIDGRLQLHPHVNIGVAIGTADGLVVPVIHDAENLTLSEIYTYILAAQSKAEKMRFAPEDLTGGTFTISNLGMFGVERFSAILNPPQSAILAVGNMVKTPVALPDDTVAIRPLAALTLTVDHRAVDGLQAALFMNALSKLIENPTLLI